MTMKTQFKLFYFGTLSLLLAVVVWSVCTSAQSTNDLPPAAVSAPAPVPVFGAAADRAIERHQDVLTFGLNRLGILQPEVLGQPLWKYLAALAYLVLALWSSKILNWLVANRLKRWAAQTKTAFDDILIEIVQGPIKVVAFVIFLHIGLRMMTWAPAVEHYLSIALRLVVAWSLTYMVVKAITVLLTFWQKKLSTQEDRVLDDQLFPLLRKVLTVTVVIIAILLTCDNLGIKITSVLAGLSIGGLALGLAAQDTVANLFGAVAVFMDKPFRLGDRIKLDSVDGTVESIGLRSTRVRNLDGHLVTIPNKTVGNATITNVSKRPNIKTVMSIGLTYDTPAARVQAAKALLEEIYGSHPKTADLVVGFDRFADFFLNLSVTHWWGGTDYKEYFAGMHELNLKVKERFDAAGLSFAFPTQTVHLRQDSEWRMTGSMGRPETAAN